MKIMSVDWAFHKTGIAIYDSETKTITTTIWEINKNVKINWWNIHFYKDIKKEMNLLYLRTLEKTIGLINTFDQILVEVGFGKVDKMSLYYAWFYNFWVERPFADVMFINSQEWIKKMLKVNSVNKLKKGQDKQLLKEQFNKRFNIVGDFTQDEIDAVMMLLWKYPNLKVKKVEKSKYQF